YSGRLLSAPLGRHRCLVQDIARRPSTAHNLSVDAERARVAAGYEARRRTPEPNHCSNPARSVESEGDLGFSAGPGPPGTPRFLQTRNVRRAAAALGRQTHGGASGRDRETGVRERAFEK